MLKFVCVNFFYTPCMMHEWVSLVGDVWMRARCMKFLIWHNWSTMYVLSFIFGNICRSLWIQISHLLYIALNMFLSIFWMLPFYLLTGGEKELMINWNKHQNVWYFLDFIVDKDILIMHSSMNSSVCCVSHNSVVMLSVIHT